MKKITLHRGREKSLLRRHPWVFASAVKNFGAAESGDIAHLLAEDGAYLATAAVSAQSQIVARVLSWDEAETIDEAFYQARINSAVARRQHLNETTNAYRLMHGESDGLPGVVADRYADVVVLQLSTAGIEPQRELLAALIQKATGARTIYERSDADVRKLEGLGEQVGLLRGEPLAESTIIIENGMTIAVDIAHGHKTGFYLDQRDNRALTKTLAYGAEVLNTFSYTGAMSVAAILGGAADVISIDSSASALALARSNAALNNCDLSKMTFLDADVFMQLRKFRDAGRQFDLIILDPPKLAPTAHHVEKAARAYKDMNLLALKLLRAGGKLMTYSCSGGVSPDLFQKIVAGAALDAGVEAQIIQRLTAGRDHPVSVHFPEGDYLKGLLVCKL